jgi:probable phosphoglycerate mutase
MKLYFIRHGESEANLLNEFSNGLNKHPLTEKGRQQVLDLAGRLKGQAYTACYTSPILRATQTAEILCAELGIACQPSEALREFDVGILEGRSDEAAWQTFWELWEAWLVQGDYAWRIEGGESFNDVRQRFMPLLDRLVKEYGKSPAHLLMVTHGGLIRSMLPLVLVNIDYSFVQNRPLHHTDVIITESTARGLVCRQWGEISL